MVYEYGGWYCIDGTVQSTCTIHNTIPVNLYNTILAWSGNFVSCSETSRNSFF